MNLFLCGFTGLRAAPRLRPMAAERQFLLRQVVGENLAGEVREPALVVTVEPRVIGRSRKATLGINVPTVSREHTQVWLDGGQPYVKDLNSGHGTYVNSSRIDQPTVVRQGDLVGLGKDVVFLVSGVEEAELAALEHAKFCDEDSVDTSLVELALTDTASEARFKQYLDALAQLLAEFERVVDEKEVYEAVIDQLYSIIPADRFLGLAGRDVESLSIVARRLRKPEDTEHWNPPSMSILQRALASEKPIISFDAQSDQRFRRRRSIEMTNVRSAICMAVRSRKGKVGVLYADTLAAAGLHSLDDGSFMMQAARCAATHLELLSERQKVSRLKLSLDDNEAESEEMLGALATRIGGHLERLERHAAQVVESCENDQNDAKDVAALISSKLNEECQRLRKEVDRYVRWETRETTMPGIGKTDGVSPTGERTKDGSGTGKESSIPELPELDA